MKRLFSRQALFIGLFFIVFQSYAQNENNIWINNAFGSLNFNSGSAPTYDDIEVMLPPSGLSKIASVCDSTGKLLFFTNGREVYTSSGSIMPHGIIDLPRPNYSLLVPTLIVKEPGILSEYYVFTLPGNDSAYSDLYYSVVDMSLNGGEGDIDISRKNIKLAGNLMNSFLVGMQAEDCNLWISVRKNDRNTFMTYSLTSSGIGQPIYSSAGFNTTTNIPPNSFGVRSMFGEKSNDGRKISLISSEMDHLNGNTFARRSLQLLNFNRAIGVFTNDVILFQDSPSWYSFNLYPTCFSPDDSKLYTVNYIAATDSRSIIQYDLSVHSEEAIIQSKHTIGTVPPPVGTSEGFITDMRLGKDGRIYIASGSPIALARINEPNRNGSACFLQHDLYPSPYPSGGIPVLLAEEVLIPSDFKPEQRDLLGGDTVLCNGKELLLLPSHSSNEKYTWQDGSIESSYKVQKEGTYTVRLESSCGAYSDSIHIAFQSCSCDLIMVPTAFSPNGDGINDEFLPLTDCGTNISFFDLKIYDRWGAIIFSSMNPQRGWNGYKGKTLADIGTYFYRIRITPLEPNRPILFKKGDLTLLR
jgi:gliding motility-associated-like protein